MVIKFEHDRIKVPVLDGVEAKITLNGSLKLSFTNKSYLESDDKNFEIGIYIPKVKVIPEEKEELRKRIVKILGCCPNQLFDVLNEEIDFILKESLSALESEEINEVEEKDTKIRRFMFGYKNKVLEKDGNNDKIIVKLNEVIGHMGYIKNIHYEDEYGEPLWEPLFIDFNECDIDVEVKLRGLYKRECKIKDIKKVIEDHFRQTAVKGEFPYGEKFPKLLILDAIADKVEESLEDYEEEVD